MKKYKGVVMGFVAGAMCMVTVSAMAATYAKIEASVLHDVIFEFNGEKVTAPSNQPVLNYNGYTYLPVRFVGESLDAEVNWDPAKRLVSIDLEPEVIEKVVEVEVPYYITDPDKVSKAYKELPVSCEKDDFEVEVKVISIDEGLKNTKFIVDCENESKRDEGFTIVNSSAKLVVDGEDIRLDQHVTRWDEKWGTYYITKEDPKTEGYILFEQIDEEWTKMTLSFDVMKHTGERETYTYNIVRDKDDE